MEILPENRAGLALLSELARAGLRFLVVGSAGYGLLHSEELAGRALPDVDVLVPTLADARALVSFLRGRGFSFSCWGVPLDDAWRDDDVRGKLYVRGARDGLQIDVTFEGAPFDVPDAFARAVLVDGIPVCPERELAIGRARKEAEASR